jgi:hypothetical protein
VAHDIATRRELDRRTDPNMDYPRSG